MSILDPKSPRGQQIIRNAAFMTPTTQGDPPPPEAQPLGPMVADKTLIANARETAKRAGPSEYRSLCVLIEVLCDEVERVDRLRYIAGYGDGYFKGSAGRDVE